MDAFITRYCLSILLLTSIGTSAESNETKLDEPREPRVSGRIVKLYTGAKPEPYLCAAEGFQADPINCAVFYRCVKERSGKFTVFKYQCAPGTVYDPDVEICNHARSTRRIECGGMQKTTIEPFHTSNINEIDGAQSEVPRPISTNMPIYYTEPTTLKNPTALPWIPSTPHQSIPTKITWGSTIYNSPSTQDASQHKTTKSSGSTVGYQWSSPTKHQAEIDYTFRTTLSPKSTEQSNFENNEPCTSDGFMGDSENCRKFYRCVGNQRGGYLKYEFSCGESTVWDDDLQGCNHPWAVKRSKCGRSLSFKDKYSSQKPITHTTERSTLKDPILNNDKYGYKLNKTIQQQLQISHGSKVTQTQTQISNSNEVIQNQTQISFGNKKENNKKTESKQNQTQISYGTAISQTQTQIDYGNKGVQTQLQIDHSKDSSQSQVQIQDSTTAQSVITSAQNSNNGNNKCSKSGFMGDENDCKKFYRCVDNGRGTYTRFEYFCGEGTVWDPELEACNHAWAVKHCGGTLPQEPTSEEHTSTTTTMKSTEYHQEPTKTTQTYYTSQVPDEEDEDDVGYGNQMNQETTLSSTTVKTTTITIKSTTTAENSNKTTTECSSSGFIGEANDCKIFYRCVDNGRGGFTKHEFKCGDGTVWDPDIEACNHAWAVKNCGGSTSNNVDKQETTTKIENTTPSGNTPSIVTLIQITTQASTQIDDYDTGYGSQNQEPAITTIKTTKQPQEQDINKNNECKSSGFMGDVNNCKKFYRCVDDGNGGYIRYEFTCGEGTVWDPKIDACNHAWDVEKCGGSNNVIDNVETTSQSTLITSNGDTSSVLTTQSNKNTDEPAYTMTTSTTVSTTTSSSTSSVCSNSGFMGDSSDCKRFYRCVDNGDGSYARYEFTCGEGTVWDPKLEACNHAWAVKNCGENVETTSQSIAITSYGDTSSFSTTQGNKDTDKPIFTTTTSTTSSSTTTSITSNDCLNSGFLGDSSDCKRFYRCVDSGDGSYIRYEFTCGEGTVWDPKIEACNHAWAVEKCGGGSESTHINQETTSQNSIIQDEEHENGYATPSYETSDTPQITSTSSSSVTSITSSETSHCNKSGFMGDKSNCKKFYRCVDNGSGGYDRYEFLCGEGTVWDESIEACNHAWAVKDCGKTESSTSHVQNESTTQSTSSFVTSEISQITEKATTTTEAYHETDASNGCMQEGFFGNNKDCKKFYRCVDNGKGGFTKFEFTCGEGTSWSQDKQGCDHITPDRPCSVSSQEPIYLNDDMETQTVYTTKPSMSTEKTESESTQTTKKPQAAKGTCESEGFYGSPSDCKKFYRCVANGNGGYTKYDFNCGDGTIWNQEIQACDHESVNKTCSGSSSSQNNSTEPQSESTTSSYLTTKKQETTDKTQPPHTMTSECISEGFFAHPNDCKKFIRCVSNGKGGYTHYEFSCGDGTVWVQEIQACDHDNDVTSCSSQSGSTLKPENTEEHSSSTADSSLMSSTESITPHREDDEYDIETSKEPSHDESDDCTSEGYFANKNDCRKFYRCVDNGNGGYTKYDFACGEGTAWDANQQTCNHIKEVQSCSGSSQEGSGDHQTTTDKNQGQTENTSSTTKATTSSSESSSGSTSSSNSQDSCESEGYFGDSDDCKKFYRCVDNGNGGYTKYDFTCGDGTIWDQDIVTCNHPKDVSNPSCKSNQGTSGSDTSTTSSTTTSSTQTISNTTESSSSSQGTSDCSQESSKQPTNNSVTCDKAGYYANPNDSKKFYRCVDWDGDGKRFSVFHFECGEGTIWDPAVDTCNHEDSVYPKRNCSQTQSQNVAGETTTSTTTESSISEQTTTQQSTTSEQNVAGETTTSTTTESSISEQTTTQQSTTSEQTTTEQSTNEQTTTQQSTTSEQTTQQITSEKTTTQESSTTEQTTAQQPTTSEKTTTQESTTREQSTSSETTTTQESTSITQQPSTSEQTTTQETTTSEQTTTQPTSTSEQITSEQTTTQQTSTSEPTTAQQSTTTDQTTTQGPPSEQTTTQQSTTSEQTTTQQSTTSEQTSTQESTTSVQTTQQSTTSEQTTTQESTSEPSTTQQSTTSEQTTTQQSTSDQTTTEQSTTTSEQTTTQQSTSDQTTTEQSTTSEVTTTEQSNQQATTDSTEQTTKGTTTTEQASSTQASSTEFDSTDQSTTEVPSSSNKECPETDDDQYLLVCPTSFKRHPKYCNMFYQCTEDDETYEAKVAIFKCPNNTIYDERQTQCVTEDKSDKKCDGEIANKRRFKRLGSNYKDPILADTGKQSCSGNGYFLFEKYSECSKGFLKCERRKNGQLEGHVYQCPDGYIYWSISKRCERIESIRDCKRSSNDWTGRWNIPVERKNIAPS